MPQLQISQLHVKIGSFPVNGRPRGYRVELFLPGEVDGQWEHLLHKALLATRREADRLVAAISSLVIIDLDHWVWAPCSTAHNHYLRMTPVTDLQVALHYPPF